MYRQLHRKPRERRSSSTARVPNAVEEKQVTAAGSVTQSNNHQLAKPQQQQQQPIRTTRSSRLRAAALEKERGVPPSTSANAFAIAASEDTQPQRLRVPSTVGHTKLHSPLTGSTSAPSGSSGNSNRRASPSIIASKTSSSTATGVASIASLSGGNRLIPKQKKSPITTEYVTSGGKPRLVPTIAVSMKQKLRETSETISKSSDINRNNSSNMTIPTAAVAAGAKTIATMLNNNANVAGHVSNVLNGNNTCSSAPNSINNNNEDTETVETAAAATVVEAFFERIPSTTNTTPRSAARSVSTPNTPTKHVTGSVLPKASSGGGSGVVSGAARLSSISSLSSLESPRAFLGSPRMRTSTMKGTSRAPPGKLGKESATELSPAKSGASSSNSNNTSSNASTVASPKLLAAVVERDKSSKRKSNLNRAQHEEATATRPSTNDRRRHQKSASAPISSPEQQSKPVAARTSFRATTAGSSSSSKSLRKSHFQEKLISTPIPSPISTTADTTPASSPHPRIMRAAASTLGLQPSDSGSTLLSSTTSLATAASSAPSTPSKFSPQVWSSKTPSPTARLLYQRRSPPSQSILLHSSSSSATLAGEVSASGSQHEAVNTARPISNNSSNSSSNNRNRLDVIRVDSRISGGSEQEADVQPESPLVQQYSKFSQMLKSPTLEKYQVSPPLPRPAVEDDIEELEAMEDQQEVPLDEEQPEMKQIEEKELVPLEVELQQSNDDDDDEEAEAATRIIVIEHEEPQLDLDLLEAGPSGLCPLVITDDDEVDEEELASNRMLGELRRSGSSSPRPTNRILFDDKFNDEFVVIENSPKSHFIQSLDETDIIVIGENDEDYPPRPASSNSTGAAEAYEKKLVKMSSVEHFESLHQRKSSSPQRKKSLSPIMRAKSMEERQLSSAGSPASNHIVSILKRKTVESNSSASSNASPVTFSPSVVDTPVRSNRRQGILKKRCSLDESRYSRSHSPDDRSILVKHTRRNSFEDGTQHGILKQKSYESKEDVSTTGGGSGSSTAVNSVVSHGILKKKTDGSSTSTPNEQQKHVSISQAVILAAAEICQDMLLDEHDHEIRPILKSDSQPLPTPKPILKKKYSSESEEIRPILKSSRKSSREENSDSDELKRSILKTDSPAKRRSFGDRDCNFDTASNAAAVLYRSRSLEHPEPVPVAPIVPQVQNIEKPIISVAERIKNMEKFLTGPSTGGAAAVGSVTGAMTSSSSNVFPSGPASVPSTVGSSSSSGTVPKRNVSHNASSRRESFRYKTQPVTSLEISGVQQQVDRSAENPEDFCSNRGSASSSRSNSSSTTSTESDCNPEQEADAGGGFIAESICPRGSLESLISKEKQLSEDKSLELLSPTLATAEESNSHSISGECNLASLSSDSGIQFGRGTEETSGADYVSSVKTSDSEKSPSRKTIDDDLNELEEEEDVDDHLQIIEETEGQQRLLLSPSSSTSVAAAAAAGERTCAGARRRAARKASSSCSSTSSSDLSDREVDRMYTATASAGSHQHRGPDDLFGVGPAGGGGDAGGCALDDESSGLQRSNSVRARANMFQKMESQCKENESPLMPRGRRVMPTAQFTTKTISPTDIERSHHLPASGGCTSNLISNFSNNNNISDDSGTEFDPSTLQVSKKIKLFSGGGDENSCVQTDGSTIALAQGGPRPLKKRASMKFRTIGKLVMPKFLNDNNNNISNKIAPPLVTSVVESNTSGTQEKSVVTDSEIDESQQQQQQVQKSLRVERLRRKFMGDTSTPIFSEGCNGTTNGDEGSDSNVESGKENCDSGGEYGIPNCGHNKILALKRNLLNGQRSSNKSILLNSSSELDDVMIKGKVSTMAKQWNRLRSMTVDVSSIRTQSTGTLQSAVVCNGHAPLEERDCESLPCEVDSDPYNTNNSSLLEKNSFHLNKSKRRDSHQLDVRIAKYFGVNTAEVCSTPPSNNNSPTERNIITTTSSHSAESDLSKSHRRSRFAARGNPPAPPPQRPIDERIAKYFGLNKSFGGNPSSPQATINKPRAIVKPQQRLQQQQQPETASQQNHKPSTTTITTTTNAAGDVGTAGKGRRRTRSMPQEEYVFEELLKAGAGAGLHAQKCELLLAVSFGGTISTRSTKEMDTLMKPLRTFEEFNLTAEDLSTAESEFDKLYLD